VSAKKGMMFNIDSFSLIAIAGQVGVIGAISPTSVLIRLAKLLGKLP
jgi:hypothetical protein